MTAPRTVRWTPHYRVSWGGSIGIPALEQWSNTLRFRGLDIALLGGAPVMDHGELQSISDAAAVILSGWMTDNASYIGHDAALEYVKVNWVNDQGLQPDQDTVMTAITPAVRSQSNAPSSWIDSYCLTLRTAKARGRAHAGRIYPPCPTAISAGASVVNTPYIAAAAATAMATAFARIIYALQAAFDDQLEPTSVFSHKAGVASPGDTFGKPALFEPITGVVCDRVQDVMHSRNRQVPRLEGDLVVPGP